VTPNKTLTIEVPLVKLVKTGPPVPNVIKLFMPIIYGCLNKRECLSLASLSGQVLCLRLGLEPTGVEHLKEAPLQGRLQALQTNIRLGRNASHGQTLYLIMNIRKLRM
jgi:hypothetical protein